ncbi:MAG: ribosome biogenesis GTPase YlqF [Oscillospiraceae bacterium]|nr:ribosome biogenesis GTPase YlqF [Oscillospiraceae bacterium]
MNIQWFPGHMKKAQRMMAENLGMVDAVCEIIDARIARSSRNPDIDSIAGAKPRLIIINRRDLADQKVTALWVRYYAEKGIPAIETDSKSGAGTAAFQNALRSLLKEKIEANARKGQQGRAIRAMVVGIPNVGKSSFINRVAGRRAAEASDRPGVTRGKQWISIGKGLELLDTPGILWPKFETQEQAENLAFTGAIKDEIMDTESIAAKLMLKLSADYPDALTARYKIDIKPDMSGFDLLEAAARKRGFLISGGEANTERMAAVLLDEFRGGVLGRISLERPEDEQ